MRFLKINMSHPIVFDQFYQKYDKRELRSPEEWLELFFNEGYWPSDYYEKYLAKNYGYETYTIPLTYDRKNENYKYFLENVITKIYPIKFDTSKQRTSIQNMITYFNPDILYLQETKFYFKEYLESTRKNCPNLKLIMGWRCAPTSLNNPKDFEGFDIIFTCGLQFKKAIQDAGINAVLLGHAFEPSIIQNIKKTSKKHDVVFTGHIGTKDHRKKILQELEANGANIKIFSTPENQKDFVNKIHPPLFGLEMYQLLADSKIVLNIHALDDNYAGNIRLFEVTGMGSLLLTDDKKDLNQLFDKNNEIIAFDGAKDAVKKIKYLLDNENVLNQIANQGQERTLREYSYEAKANKIHNTIIHHL
ncbi:MAG: glycosyltransferase family protein [Campylobacterota bacterium]